MKFLVLAALLAVAAANVSPLSITSSVVGAKRIQVVPQSGKILITSLATGNQLTINKILGVSGQQLTQIMVFGPSIANSKIQIQDPVVQSLGVPTPVMLQQLQQQQLPFNVLGSGQLLGLTQGDVLVQILGQYQGVVSEQIFRQILIQIQQAVLQGQVNPLAYGILVVLDTIQPPTSLGGLQSVGSYPQSGLLNPILPIGGLNSIPWSSSPLIQNLGLGQLSPVFGGGLVSQPIGMGVGVIGEPSVQELEQLIVQQQQVSPNRSLLGVLGAYGRIPQVVY